MRILILCLFVQLMVFLHAEAREEGANGSNSVYDDTTRIAPIFNDSQGNGLSKSNYAAIENEVLSKIDSYEEAYAQKFVDDAFAKHGVIDLNEYQQLQRLLGNNDSAYRNNRLKEYRRNKFLEGLKIDLKVLNTNISDYGAIKLAVVSRMDSNDELEAKKIVRSALNEHSLIDPFQYWELQRFFDNNDSAYLHDSLKEYRADKFLKNLDGE